MTEEFEERLIRDVRATLGERCVQWSLAHVGLKETPMGSDDSPDIKRWRAQCVRGDGAKARPLRLGPVSWCAIFASAAVSECLEEGEAAPHGFRAGVVELVSDASSGNYAGQYKPIEMVLKGLWTPRIGDLAIYNRAQKDKPATFWWRHVNRVMQYYLKGTFHAVGGNEGGGEVLCSTHSIYEPRLEGFIAYP